MKLSLVQKKKKNHPQFQSWAKKKKKNSYLNYPYWATKSGHLNQEKSPRRIKSVEFSFFCSMFSFKCFIQTENLEKKNNVTEAMVLHQNNLICKLIILCTLVSRTLKLYILIKMKLKKTSIKSNHFYSKISNVLVYGWFDLVKWIFSPFGNSY